MQRLAMRIALAASLATPPSPAQQIPPNLPPCNGTVAIIRLSEVKPHGMAQFQQAAAAQQAWYRSHGVIDDFVTVAPVYLVNPQTGYASFSDTEAYTFHLNPPSSPNLPRRDAAWDDFVALYRSVSKIVNERVVCMPRLTP